MTLAGWIAITGLAIILLAAYVWLRRRVAAPPGKRRRQIAVDGTNVLFWDGPRARMGTLKAVVEHLGREGFDPIVFLDASSRHHLGDRSLDAAKFAHALGIAEARVVICPARTQADEFILRYARDHKLPVVSNDRFRDRPQAARNIRLVRGRFDGKRAILKGL